MRQGLYTSGFFHIFGGFLLIVNFQVLEENPNEVLNKVSVKLLSEQELMNLRGRKTSAKIESFQPRNIADLNVIQKFLFLQDKCWQRNKG